MKITFVVPFLGMSGGIRVVAIYAKALAGRGHEVTVVSTPLAQPSFISNVKSLVRGRGWHVNRRARCDYFDGFDGTMVELERFRPIVDADVPDADVVIATWWETAEWVGALSDRKGAKVNFLQHYEAHPGQPKDRVDAAWRLPMRRIVVSEWLERIAIEQFGLARPDLVANAVDLVQFQAPRRGKRAQPTVGVMYSPVVYKGCDVSLEAFRIAQRRIGELRLVAFGSTPPAEHLPLPEGADYHLRPAQGRIAGLYAQCDAWLFASRTEGFGLPILEAMACRTPVIGTPAGAAPELIGAGGGVLVPGEDADAMAEAIVRIAEMGEDAWGAMSDAAHATATGYTWSDATDRFERALERAACEADSAVTGRSANHPAARITAA